jgi:GNAT superfamily N-acetyltransferase
MSKIWARSFDTDRNTQLKMQGKNPYDLEKRGPGMIENWMKRDNLVVIKAVDVETGTIAGWCCWGFRGFDKDELPIIEEDKSEDDQTSAEESDAQISAASASQEDEEEEDPNDPANRLNAFTGGHMSTFMKNIMPEGTKCMYIVTLTVSPSHHNLGVGSALLSVGTEWADKVGQCFAWVHASDNKGAVRVYEKAGFVEIDRLVVNLDEYDPMEKGVPKELSLGLEGLPETDSSEGKQRWGEYTFRYMKRMPR